MNFKIDISKMNNVSPLVFAYMGDVIYEKYVREYLILSNYDLNVNKLHKTAIKLVSAKYQYMAFNHIMSEITEEEMDIFKRGRNSKSNSSAKSTSIVNYRISTGFESLLGYLYFKGDKDRIDIIMKMTIDYLLDEDKKNEKQI